MSDQIIAINPIIERHSPYREIWALDSQGNWVLLDNIEVEEQLGPTTLIKVTGWLSMASNASSADDRGEILNELEDLHRKNEVIQKKIDDLYKRLHAVLAENPQDPAEVQPVDRTTYLGKQLAIANRDLDEIYDRLRALGEAINI